MKKCLSLLIALSLILSVCVLPVSASEAEVPAWVNLPEGAKLVFAENFEEGYAEGNLLTQLDADGNIFKADGTKALWYEAKVPADQAAEVVNGPEAFNTSKVLKLTNKNTTAANYLAQKIYLNNGAKIKRTAGTQFVIEYDVLLAGARFGGADSTFMTYTEWASATTNPPLLSQWTGNGIGLQNGNYATATSTPEMKKDWFVRPYVNISNKQTIRVVVEQDLVENFDSARLYYGEGKTLLTGKASSSNATDWNTGRVFKDFMGAANGFKVGDYANTTESTAKDKIEYSNEIDVLWLKLTSNGKDAATGKNVVDEPATIYLDNIKIYEIPAINFTGLSKTEGVQLSEGVVVNFDQPFNATKDTFKVSAETADTWIEDAVTDVIMSKDKKSAVVKFDVNKLPDGTEFKLWIDDEFTSAAGAIFYKDLDGVKAEEEYVKLTSFITLVPLKVIEKPESISGIVPNDPRKFEIKTSGKIDGVTATFGETDLETSYNDGTATFSFANVDAPKAGDVVVTITEGEQSIEVTIPATSVADGFTTIFNDNLEGYAEGNLITDASGKQFTNGNLVFNTAAASLEAGGKSEIVIDPEQGKVLKFKTTGVANHSVMYAPTGEAPSILGKVLVLKVKYNFPSTYTTNNSNSGAAGAVAPYSNSTGTSQTPDFRIRTKGALGYNSGNYSHNFMEEGGPAINDKWFELTTVIDQTTAGTLTDPHTARRYYDGEIDPIFSYDKDAGEAKADQHTMYDTPPTMYEGIWDFSKAAKYYETTAESKMHTKFGTNKLNGLYTAAGTADSETYFFIDDFQAYFADKFQITSISENQEAFVPTRHTLKVVFNQPIDQAQADLVELYTAAGEKVEGMDAAVANGGYAIDFTLPAVDPGAYKLSISPAFHDVRSFQGLGSKNHNYEIPVTVTEYTAFKASATPTEIIGFVNGKTTKSVVTLSNKTSLVDSNAKSAFTVVNGKGEEVTEGWAADVADDQMSITLDFTDLATDSYTVTSNENLVDKDGFGLDSEAIEITIAPRQDKIMLFEEDFEKGYTLDADWLDAAPANGKFKAGYTRARADKTAYDADSITVTNNIPEGAVNANISGNALHIYAEQEETRVTKGIGVKGVMDPVAIATAYPGKVLVMEVDVFSPTTIGDGTKPIIASFSDSLAPGLDYYKHNGNGVKYEGTWFSYTTASHAAPAWHTRWDMANTSKDFKFVQVIDQRGDMDTVKMYVNGNISKDVSNTLFADHPLYQQTIYEYPLKSNNGATDMNKYWGNGDAGTFYGPILLAQTYKDSKNVTCSDMYLDNIKVYLVDAFEITSIEGASTAYNAAKDTVKFNFTNKVKSLDNVAANIKLVDANGAVVENGVTYSLAEGGFQVIATLNAAVIDGSAEYKFIVSPELQDEFGASLAHKYYYYNYVSNGGTAYIVAHGQANSLFNGKAYAWVKTEAEADALVAKNAKAVKYPYTWTVDADGNATAENPVKPGTSGTVNANGWVRDEAAMKLVTVIKTTKATGLYAEATDAVVDGKNVSTTLTFVNPEDDTMDVWYIVAAYGDYNEMIGCQAASIEVVKGIMDPININFEAKSSNIKSVKVYVWDGYKTMVPYQDAEELLK